jgi:hypothetical protein
MTSASSMGARLGHWLASLSIPIKVNLVIAVLRRRDAR